MPTLAEWLDRLRSEAAGAFPEKVTAFRQGMAVHGRFKEPCPVCRSAGPADRLCGQRVQLLRDLPDGGPSLADRSLSRLLKDAWPRRLESN